MCLQRHIISLDLREFNKYCLYQVLHRPQIGNEMKSYKDVVYLFEEFDISIKELYLREKKNDKKTELYHEQLIEFFI